MTYTDPEQCNALLCAEAPHEGDQHCDVTGHTWTEATPDSPVIAHVYGMLSDLAAVHGGTVSVTTP